MKEEANHWHRALLTEPYAPKQYLIIGAGPANDPVGIVLDFCSERCLISYVSRFIGQDQKEQRYVEPVREEREILTEDDAPF